MTNKPWQTIQSSRVNWFWDEHGQMLCLSLLPQQNARAVIDIFNLKKSISTIDGLIQFILILHCFYIFESHWNTNMSQRNWVKSGLLPSVLHKIGYMILEIVHFFDKSQTSYENI